MSCTGKAKGAKNPEVISLNPKEVVLKASRCISQSGLVKGTWGNVSLLEDDRVYITPSGVLYDELETDCIAVVDLKTGEQIEGKLRASSELPMHLQIYRDHQNIKAIVHIHSTFASAFACMRKPIPCFVEDQAMILGGTVPVAEYAQAGTWKLAQNVSRVLEGRFAALLANHGAVAVGRNMKEALIAAQILEKSAHIAYLIGDKGHSLSKEDAKELRTAYLSSYSKGIK